MTPGTHAANATNPTDAALHAGFLALLPQLRAHAEFAFRHWKCPQNRNDAVAEVIGLCWKWYVRLVERAKDPHDFPTAIAQFASRQVRSGRHVAGSERANDVLAPSVQRRHGFVVASLPSVSTLNGNVFDEALRDNTQTPVPEQAAFRIDFPIWLLSLGDRNRHVAEAMMAGERTFDLAERFGLTAGRVSQLRRDFHDDWCRFTEAGS